MHATSRRRCLSEARARLNVRFGSQADITPSMSALGPKGMAEVNMIPVAPALLNAIYDATGHRFRSLPVTQAMIKGVLK
jgi:CO/xanthine dehydrogenase Mo-binding subunit